jgi:hypothetical protein
MGRPRSRERLKIEKGAPREKREDEHNIEKGPGCGRAASRHAPACRTATTTAPRPTTPRLHATASSRHPPSCPGSPLPPCPICRLLVLPRPVRALYRQLMERVGVGTLRINPNYSRVVVGGGEGLGRRWWEEERVSNRACRRQR